MAIGWLTVLKMVPWGDVISNAPKVAEGAKKLWSTVAKKPPVAELVRSNAPQHAADAQTLAQLQKQLDAAVAEIADLHQQMLASSELIQALADQNAQLIRRVEINRMRLLALGVAATLGVILAVISLVITLAG